MDKNTSKAPSGTTSPPTAPSNVPGPYTKGVVLDLRVNWTRDGPSEERVLFTVNEVFDITVSPTMEVQWVSSSGETQTAILKLFDRRYGYSRLSDIGPNPEHSPSVEACWQRYVLSGQAPDLFNYIGEMDRDEGQGVWDLGAFADGEPTADTWETTAKKEGMHQYRALQRWKSEIRAYEHLERLQGKCVPLFYGTTSFCLTPSGSDPEFFQVGGIIIQHIDGFTLDSLLNITEVSLDTDWEGLVQHVVEVAEEVNKCGVINEGCQPFNMIIQTPTMQPFEIDFSECVFREDFANEDKYNELVLESGNPVGFGGVVATRLNKAFKLGIKIKYGPWLGEVVEH